MIDKIKAFIAKLSEQGIVLPMIQDPKTKIPSVSLTMMIVSFNVVLLGLIGKSAGFLGGVDLQQAIYWFMITSGLYFGRSLTYKDAKQEKEDK